MRQFDGKIVGYDIDARMLNAARMNVEAAEMEDVIEIKSRTSLILKRAFPTIDGI